VAYLDRYHFKYGNTKTKYSIFIFQFPSSTAKFSIFNIQLLSSPAFPMFFYNRPLGHGSFPDRPSRSEKTKKLLSALCGFAVHKIVKKIMSYAKVSKQVRAGAEVGAKKNQGIYY